MHIYTEQLNDINSGPILTGHWHHGNGALVNGTVRVAKADFDTDLSDKIVTEVFDWVCDTLNKELDYQEQKRKKTEVLRDTEYPSEVYFFEGVGALYCNDIKVYTSDKLTASVINGDWYLVYEDNTLKAYHSRSYTRSPVTTIYDIPPPIRIIVDKGGLGDYNGVINWAEQKLKEQLLCS